MRAAMNSSRTAIGGIQMASLDVSSVTQGFTEAAMNSSRTDWDGMKRERLPRA